MNIKEVVTGFTIDVIASTSFGTDTDANGDRSNNNSFVFNGVRLFNFNPLKLAAVYSLPRSVLKSIGIRTIFPDDSLEFFVKLCRKIIQTRRRNKESQTNARKRTDLLQLMMDSFVYDKDLKATNYHRLGVDMDRDGSLNEIGQTDFERKRQTLTEDEIVAQCMIFFVAGFETTAATISHCIYQLMKNPSIQDRLYDDLCKQLDHEPIIDSKCKSNDLIEYCDTLLNKMPYLEAVIKETLRMYPPVIRIERRLGVNYYKLGGIPLVKNVLVEIPTIAVHYNPEYYPNPDRFDPERFMPHNRSKLTPYTYLPFGDGPRNCIGIRFAYQEIKMCLAQLISRYRFECTPETPDKLQFLNGSIMLNSRPFPVKVIKR
ncbi:hypothetical protein RDWZM_000467 [Blomia tropicalis]|uniref:Uncharacterized protein n=1 Tax=Blomia tropicalis TaxID=40697 RepID=A0A9Q0MCE0_BLOTA|nr:hypothetical protein RDWZM_000467 [Blomia tropicalis]